VPDDLPQIASINQLAAGAAPHKVVLLRPWRSSVASACYWWS
jgi:hypothetical protein